MPTFPSGLPLEVPLLVGVVAGLFSLLGVFVGAWLARQTDREKWLRQERSATFAEFLRQVHTVRMKSLDIIYAKSKPENEKDMQVTELFVSLNIQENIVRLYLSSQDRDTFSALKKELWLLHSPTGDQTRRIKRVDEVLSRFQCMFERSIVGSQVTPIRS